MILDSCVGIVPRCFGSFVMRSRRMEMGLMGESKFDEVRVVMCCVEHECRHYW